MDVDQDSFRYSNIGNSFGFMNHLGTETLNNIELLPNYLDKFGSPSKEKQNNLSETKNGATTSSSANSAISYRSASNPRNFGAENNFLPSLQDDRRSFGSGSSESVINNYLKVASTPPFVGKKKENVKPASADPIARSNKPKVNKMAANPAPLGKLKKAISVGNLREERKLSEYNLDKVDSWMSIQDQKQYDHKHKPGLEDLDEGQDNDTASQMSLKSNEDSRDSTYDEIVSVIKEIEEDKKRGGLWAKGFRISLITFIYLTDNFSERIPSELNLKLDSRCETAETVTLSEGAVPESGDKYK